jgi:hypothetical protein
MITKSKSILAVMTAGFVAFAPSLKAEDSDLGTMAYLHPKACSDLLDTRGFEVFWNKACTVAYLAPAPVEKPEHRVTLEGTAQLCDSQVSLTKSLKALSGMIEDLRTRSAEELKKGNDEKSQKYADRAAKAEADLEKAQGTFVKLTNIHGATVQSLFSNEVSGYDIDQFITQNKYVLYNMDRRPDIKIMPVSNSIYSFTLYRPENAGAEARSILSTTIPGLSPLVQPSGDPLTVAHVKFAGAIAGETRLTLNGTCPMLEKVNDQWVYNPARFGTVMTVNRSYDVQVKAGYSINAHLHVDDDSQSYNNITANSTNHNLTKSQIYEKLLETNAFQTADLRVDTDIPMTKDEVDDLKNGVQQRLTDRLLKLYEERGLLTQMTPIEVPAPQGGEVPVTYTATRCWSSSSWFGLSRKSGCYDYQYVVHEWNDGHSYNQVNDTQIMKVDLYENTTIYQVIPLSRSTAFFDGEVKNENK